MNSSAFVAKVITTADFEFINPPANLTGNATTPLETLTPGNESMLSRFEY